MLLRATEDDCPFEILVCGDAQHGVKLMDKAQRGGQNMDPETKRALRKLQKEVKENAPIVMRGLASEGKRLSERLYSAVARRCKSLLSRAREWEVPPGGGRTVVSQLSRVRLRSPIYTLK